MNEESKEILKKIREVGELNEEVDRKLIVKKRMQDISEFADMLKNSLTDNKDK